MGDDCRVYSTPNLLYDIEMACRDLLLAAHRGRQGLGRHARRARPRRRHADGHVGGDHRHPGPRSTATAQCPSSFTARDAVEEVARGKHNRFVVGVEKTAQRLQAKRAKAG
jgi:fluoroacetyl-CoA thioesterase